MSEIIELSVTNGVPTTTSLQIAERFEKRHADVLRSIENLECSKEFNERNFAPVAYKGGNGELRPMYAITRDGFMFLAMGFTGKEAAVWKERFIAAFNAMEKKLLTQAAESRVQQPASYPQLSHSADIMVNADRTFRAGMRSGRLLGLSTAQTIRRANQIALERTGVDLLEELKANGHVEDMEAAEQAQSQRYDFKRQTYSNVHEFLEDWQGLRVIGPSGQVVPFCPCLGSQLYKAYEQWCRARGVHVHRMQEVIGTAGKKPGWRAGEVASTWSTPQDPTVKTRKMLIPTEADMERALGFDETGAQAALMRGNGETKGHWLTRGFFAFADALGSGPMAA